MNNIPQAPRKIKTCPECGRPFPPPIVVRGAVRQALVNALSRRPDGMSRDELMYAVYGSLDTPVKPQVIPVMIKKVRPQLRAQGFDIRRSWLGPGCRFFLVSVSRSVKEET